MPLKACEVIELEGRKQPQLVLLDHGLYYDLCEGDHNVRLNFCRYWQARLLRAHFRLILPRRVLFRAVSLLASLRDKAYKAFKAYIGLKALIQIPDSSYMPWA